MIDDKMAPLVVWMASGPEHRFNFRMARYEFQPNGGLLIIGEPGVVGLFAPGQWAAVTAEPGA